MPLRPDTWSLEQSVKQWILTYSEGTEMSIKLYARGPVTERAEGDPRRIAAQVSGEALRSFVVSPRQVHGKNIIRAEKNSSLPARPEADGLFIDKRGIIGSLQFADCLPVVVCGRFPRNWIVFGHSGFVGTGKNVVSAMLSHVMETCGPGSLEGATAWIGPGICRECYERRIEDPWTRWGMKVFPREYVILKREKVHFDLPGMIEHQFLDYGIPKNAVSRIPYCTRCQNDVFYSYRAGDRQRNFLLARIDHSGHKGSDSGENDCSDLRVSSNPNFGV
ncbi:MAG: polyphenol oxidase family protein [Thermovirgaceae bacterium]